MFDRKVTGFTTARGDHLLIVEAHVCSTADVMDRMIEANQLMKSTGIDSIAVDTAFVHAIWTDHELETLVPFAVDLVGDAKRIGLVRVKPSADDKFADLVARYRSAGINIEMFDTMQDAIEWLRS